MDEENTTPFTASVDSTTANNYREDATGWTEITDVQGSFNPTTGEFTVPFSTNAAAGEAYIMEYQIDYEFQIDNTNATVVLNSLSPFKATPVIGFSILGYNGQYSNLSTEQVINQGSVIPVGVTALTSGIVTGSVALMSDGTVPATLTAAQVANVVVGWQNGYCQFTGALPVNVELIVNSVRIKITPTANIQVIGGIYGTLGDLIDTFAEAWMGRNGRVRVTGPIELQDIGGDVEAIVDGYINTLIGFTDILDAQRDTDLLNIRDEILSEFNKLKYLLTLK